MRVCLLSLLNLLLVSPVTAAERDGLDDVAMPALRDALRASPPLAQAWFRLKAGDAVGARREARALVRLTPRDPDVLHVAGIAAAADGRPLESERLLRRSLRRRPDGWVTLHLVNVLLDLGRDRPAERVLTTAPNDDPQIERARAYLLVARNDLEAARDLLAAAFRSSPSHELSFQLAELLDELADVAGAAEAAERAVTLAPENGRYRRRLLELLGELGAWERLAEAAAAPGADRAGASFARWQLGVAKAKLGQDGDAVTALAGVLEAPGAEPAALAGAAAWLLQLGAYADAEDAARGALSRQPEDPALHHLLAMLLSRQERESEALAHYRRAADGKDDAAWRFDLLVSLCGLQRTDEFGAALDRARRDFPDDPRWDGLQGRCVAP